LSPEATLQEYLNHIRARDRQHYSFENNHAPMVLIAMYRLGASSDRLEYYYDNLSLAHLDDQFPSNICSIEPTNWKAHLGNSDYASSYCLFFESEINRLGREATLLYYLPHLMPGIAAHAFHPLIRLSYGLEFNDDQEIAFGLGYWAATCLPGPPIPADRPSVTITESFQALVNSSVLRKVPTVSNSITGRIKQFYDHDEFRQLLQPIIVSDNNSLTDLATFIAESFVVDHHFTLLHGVTSCHALRTILPYCDDFLFAINCYWTAMCALRLTVLNGPELTKTKVRAVNGSWESLFEAALSTGIVHTIKLTNTCHAESCINGGETWQRLADRELNHPSPFV